MGKCTTLVPSTPMWRNGRRGRLKIYSWQQGAGSSPAIGIPSETFSDMTMSPRFSPSKFLIFTRILEYLLGILLGLHSNLIFAITEGQTTTKESDLRLPPGYLPFEEFVPQFSLGGTSTEQLHEKTKTLSQTMPLDIVKGLEMLFEADQAVLVGFAHFIPVIESLAPDLAVRMKAGGRVFLVGSGSSGRIAVDIAAKCNLVASRGQEQIRGIIAGGDSALIRAKEGFEDSEADGEQCLRSFDLKAEDTVFLISASGSASFNVGCGRFAANKGSQVLYFYNSKDIPSRTKQLFTRPDNPVRPLELDTGPQAISGSTRLQAASLAEMCLGALLGTALLHGEGKALEASKYPHDLLVKMREGNHLISERLEKIGQFVEKEAAVFLSPRANFRRLRDETSQGYVTIVGERDSLREILMDATETSPTFSLSPIRREGETLQKRGEFRAYLAGEKDNRAAWETLLGRAIETEALGDTSQFLLALQAAGNNSYDKRPTGPGNFVMGVTKRANAWGRSKEILDLLHDVVSKGGEAGMIALSRDKMPSSSGSPFLTLVLDEVPFDHLGLVETLLLKQILNLISNGSMVLTGKVHGNRMIDVRASNQKLIDRSLRLIKEIWGDFQRPMPLSDEELYHYIAHVCEMKKSYTHSGIYTPSVVKIVLGLMYLEKKPVSGQFQEVVDFLADRQEQLDFLATENEPFTFCIDGGGSKTLLQIVDTRGRIIPLTKKGNITQSVESGTSNINVVKREGVKIALQGLFDGLKVGAEQRDFQDILPTSRVVAGMAGVSIPENLTTVTLLFQELGVRKEGLQVLTDAELALRLLKGNGVVLISGTGSICFTEKGGVRKRVGGLGPILGDEGSGYQIGLQAIRAALAEEFGYGPPTSLTLALKAFFGVTEMKSLFPQINSLEISSATIASLSPLVFEKAVEKDLVAAGIVSRAAEELRQLVSTALRISQLADCELHLWGGVFKGRFADPIIEEIRKETAPKGIKIINQSSENAGVIYTRSTSRAAIPAEKR